MNGFVILCPMTYSLTFHSGILQLLLVLSLFKNNIKHLTAETKVTVAAHKTAHCTDIFETSLISLTILEVELHQFPYRH